MANRAHGGSPNISVEDLRQKRSQRGLALTLAHEAGLRITLTVSDRHRARYSCLPPLEIVQMLEPQLTDNERAAMTHVELVEFMVAFLEGWEVGFWQGPGDSDLFEEMAS